jgi:prevent-host-death family protein
LEEARDVRRCTYKRVYNPAPGEGDIAVPLLGIRAFSRRVSREIESVIETGQPLVLTKHGRPVAAVVPINEDSLEDFVVAHAPEFTAAMKAADVELARGETKPLSETLDELEAEEEEARARERETVPERAGRS